MSDPLKLSDIDLNTYGCTQDDIIRDRQARLELIRSGAIRGNWFCSEAMYLDSLAKDHGVYVDYAEDLDEDDLS